MTRVFVWPLTVLLVVSAAVPALAQDAGARPRLRGGPSIVVAAERVRLEGNDGDGNGVGTWGGMIGFNWLSRGRAGWGARVTYAPERLERFTPAVVVGAAGFRTVAGRAGWLTIMTTTDLEAMHIGARIYRIAPEDCAVVPGCLDNRLRFTEGWHANIAFGFGFSVSPVRQLGIEFEPTARLRASRGPGGGAFQLLGSWRAGLIWRY